MRRSRAEWSIVLVALAAAVALAFYRGGEPRVGDVVRLSFSFVPEDKLALACAMPATGSYGCEFLGDGSTPSSLRDALIPAVSTDGVLSLVRGAFRGGAAVKHLADRRKNARFVLGCEARLLGLAKDVQVRFAARGQWKSERNLQIWELSGCR